MGSNYRHLTHDVLISFMRKVDFPFLRGPCFLTIEAVVMTEAITFLRGI